MLKVPRFMKEYANYRKEEIKNHVINDGLKACSIDQIDKALTRANYHKDIDYVKTVGVDYYDVIYTVIKDQTDYNKGMYQYRIKEWKK